MMGSLMPSPPSAKGSCAFNQMCSCIEWIPRMSPNAFRSTWDALCKIVPAPEVLVDLRMNISLQASRHLVRMGSCQGGCPNCPSKSHVWSNRSTDRARNDPRKEELSGCSTGTPRTRRPVVGRNGCTAMCRKCSCDCTFGGRVGFREESVGKPGPQAIHFLKLRETPTFANS